MQSKQRKIRKRGNSRNIQAIIFDLDGVLVDSEPLWERMLKEYFKQNNIVIPGDFTAFTNRHFRGAGQPAIIKYIKKRFKLQESLKKINSDRMKIIERLFKERLRLFPNARKVIEILQKEYPLAIASSAPKKTVTIALKKLKITSYISVLIHGEHVSRQKPHPQIFLKAAKQLGVPPSRCLVIEDSLTGVIAAKKARMRCVLFKTSYSTKAQIAKADYVVQRLSEIPSLVDSIYYA